MEPIELKRSWSELKVKLRQKFEILTESDLTFEKGKKWQMFENLQTKLGKTKHELHKIISAL